jgi:hypothetical protein
MWLCNVSFLKQHCFEKWSQWHLQLACPNKPALQAGCTGKPLSAAKAG